MRRIIPAILLIAVLAIGGGIIATTAYQAGLNTAVTTAGDTVTPVIVPAYGYGWHAFGAGFGFLGFLGTFLFIVIVFGLIRAIFFGGRHRHWGGPGWGDRGSHYQGGWHSTVHREFDDWHREAHDPSARPSSGPTPPDAPAG